MTTHALRRLAALGLACTAVAGFAACGSSDDEGSGGSTASAGKPTAAPALSAPDARTLADARATIAEQCQDHAAVTGAVATLEALYEIDTAAADAKGTSVREAVTDAAAQLRSCGDKAAARRLAKLVD
jgi:hypothetical protein